MPTLNFYPRFAYLVARGAKRQAVRTRSISRGDQVTLRSLGLKLGSGLVTCVRDVMIDYRGYVPVIKLDGVTLSSKSMEDFARRDGFPGLEEFIDFYAEYHDLPFNGFVVEWNLQEEAVAA